MIDLKNARSLLVRSFGNAARFVRTRRARRIARTSAVIVVLFGVIAWFGVPVLIQHYAVQKISAALDRPVSIGKVRFNPYTLRLDLTALHIGEREGGESFVDVDHLVVNSAWSSLFRLAPVIDALSIDRMKVHVLRTADQRFNFSDLLAGGEPAKPAARPARFAVYNIKVHDSSIVFDDRLLGAEHKVEQIEIGIPFIANLPSDIDVYVQPLLQLSLDGSPMRLTGKSKPFSATRESSVDLKLERVELASYFGYVPVELPVKVPKGLLTADLQLHFVQAGTAPAIALSGTLAVEDLAVTDIRNAPLLTLKRVDAILADVQPLRSLAHLRAVKMDSPELYFTIGRDGRSNLQQLQGQGATGAPASTADDKPKAPFDLAIESLDLSGGALHYADQRGTPAISFGADALRLRVQRLTTLGKTPMDVDLAAQLAGGTAAIKGSIGLAVRHANAEVHLEKIDLASLQAFMRPLLAANIKSGSFAADAKIDADFSTETLGLKAQAASARVEAFELRTEDGRETPLSWKSLQVGVDQLDLSTRQATLSEVRGEGLALSVRRERDGSLNLDKLLRSASVATNNATAVKARTTGAKSPAWRATIAAFALDNSSVQVDDEAVPRPVKIAFAPFDLALRNVSTDLSKPLNLDLKGRVGRKGSLNVAGDFTPQPLAAQLRINARQFDITPFEPYVADRLNASIASASLSTEGALTLATVAEKLRVGYRGNATLGDLRLLDKLSDEDFLSWNALSATGLDLGFGNGAPKAHVTALALSKFYARIIVSTAGKLNLENVVARPETAPVSLTGAEAATAPKTPTPNVPDTAASAGAPKFPAADIALGQITLQGGRVNYSDNFVKPNYSADVTDIAGTVGAFGTASTTPANVVLRGRLDRTAPVDITGRVNPLAPEALVDITAKADRVELTHLTPYATRYAGYPIVKGVLTLDVHYLLEHGRLEADNHIFIDQLTLGERIDSPGATTLPVRLALALLKNSRGEIDLRVPVSGSLSDPQFSLGSVIWHAFVNLIEKAVTSPFRLLGSAFGGGDEKLGYVEFEPGLATLTPASQTRIDTLAKALLERPSLRLDIVGRADPALDTSGLREVKLAERVRAQKLRDVKNEDVDPASVQVAPEEYPKYLERAYKAEKFAKPRNAIGLNKSLPPEEMKTLLLTNMQVGADDLSRLADARALVVQQQLIAKVDPARVFIVAPRLDANGIEDKGRTTRVDFVLN